MEKRKTQKALRLAYRLAYGLGVASLVASMVIGLSVSTASSALAAPAAQQEVCYCHNVNNNPVTICTNESGKKQGHDGHVNNGTDTIGACREEDPTEEPTEEPTTAPTDPPPEVTPTVAPPSGGDGDGEDDTSTVFIPVTGFSVVEGGQSSQAILQDTGFGLLGLGLVLHGIAAKKKREVA